MNSNYKNRFSDGQPEYDSRTYSGLKSGERTSPHGGDAKKSTSVKTYDNSYNSDKKADMNFSGNYASPSTNHRRKNPNARFYGLIAAVAVMLIIFILGFLNLVIGDKQYSGDENRVLAQKPELTAASLFDGSFMTDTESYLSDQFAGRSGLMRARTAIDIFLGKKEENNVYIGKNHFLFEKPSEYNEERVGTTLSAIKSFTEKHKKIHSYAALIPNSTEILPEYMPKNAPNENQTNQINIIYSQLPENIKTLDMVPVLKTNKNRDALYYRTDHHWTTKAAALTFGELAPKMNLKTDKVKYKTYAVTNSFNGTLSSSAGLFNAKDTIYVTLPESKVEYVVKYVAENKKSASVFDSSKLSAKNKYEVFLGGNFSEIKIETSLNSKRVLMIFKDSYANSLIPMLTPYFRSIIVVDPRYYNGDIEKLVKRESVSDVLWLYNVNTFLSDTSIKNTFS